MNFQSDERLGHMSHTNSYSSYTNQFAHFTTKNWILKNKWTEQLQHVDPLTVYVGGDVDTVQYKIIIISGITKCLYDFNREKLFPY